MVAPRHIYSHLWPLLLQWITSKPNPRFVVGVPAMATASSLPPSLCITSKPPNSSPLVFRPLNFPIRTSSSTNLLPYNIARTANDRSTFIAQRRGLVTEIHSSRRSIVEKSEDGDSDRVRGIVRAGLWTAEAVYVLWLFLLPFAPGDPVWAISSETIDSLIGLSLNFFFVLPLANAVGIHLLEAPVLHPMSEGLFNFVIAWTLMFAPLLYTDLKRDRFKGSIDVLWGLQMFLTNTFLIPYMAFRMNEEGPDQSPRETSNLGSIMIKGAQTVALTGGAVCLLSILWSFIGRADGDFGTINDRWQFLLSYLGSERLAYAFIWDIALYTVFQPWLIGDNLQNVRRSMVRPLSYLRFIPVVGLVAYLLCFDKEQFEST